MATTIGTKTDAEIQRDVLDELKWDARVQPNEIGVAVKDGVVTLIGWVDSYTKKWAAEEAALRVRGVKAVASAMEMTSAMASTVAVATAAMTAAASGQCGAGQHGRQSDNRNPRH